MTLWWAALLVESVEISRSNVSIQWANAFSPCHHLSRCSCRHLPPPPAPLSFPDCQTRNASFGKALFSLNAEDVYGSCRTPNTKRLRNPVEFQSSCIIQSDDRESCTNARSSADEAHTGGQQNKPGKANMPWRIRLLVQISCSDRLRSQAEKGALPFLLARNCRLRVELSFRAEQLEEVPS